MIFRESETVELKSIVVEDIKKEIIAFANANGGTIYIGVQNDGTVVGVDDTDEVALQISNMVRDTIKPDLTMFVRYEDLEEQERRVVAVHVQRGTNRPYYIARKGLRPEGVYVRQGYSAAPATDTAIRQMIKETDGDHYEDMRSMEQELTYGVAGKEFVDRGLSFGQPQMRSLGVINRDGVYTNLGLLLSDQCTHSVKAAVFQGTDSFVFKNRREFSGSLFQQMEDLFNYIDFYNQTRSTFKGLLRIDQRDYPEVAIREALLNLLIHREYASAAGAKVSIYEDRIEFLSIGGLVDGISLDDVMMGTFACRNPRLANVFYHLELIEAYGTGIRKIMVAYEGMERQPEIKTTSNAFCITLPNVNAVEATPTLSLVRESAPVFGQSAGARGALDREMQSVAKLAQQQGCVTRADLEQHLQISQATANRLLRQMEERGILVREGRGKNTHYRNAD